MVVSGSTYEAFAEDLFRSAHEFFRPTKKVLFLMLHGRPGWPDATMYRHHVLRDHMPNTTYVFMSDADMRFEGMVGPEILSDHGITATQHPGYVDIEPKDFPYERRPESSACVYSGGERYYAGGFVGGSRQAMLHLSAKISTKVDSDVSKGITPIWHDESCLNRCLLDSPPQVVLSPAYCHPDNDSYYRTTVWPENYERKLVALDKTRDERGERG